LPYLKVTRMAPKPGPFPSGPQTLGEHLKQRRLALGLLQREVAIRIGVSEWTVINWETGLRKPRISHYPDLIDFLGFDPEMPIAADPADLQAVRRALGVSWAELARQIGVDEGTIRDCHQQRRQATGRTIARISTYLASTVQRTPQR
jgi:DNA-binding transcriptional regulator YiaG